ncbi:hypothetical protein [Clostridium botulinum]|uniref:hypothetical protein n=1 Tax=Clostridium botulinum TaxID=1491 RepID=UPI0007738229|nr:hypothetical protein [Clostridium botulinum]
MKNFKKLLSALLVFCGLAILNPVQANAAWQQNSTGYWYTEGTSWATGWRLIDEQWYYFDSNGYVKTGWIYDNGKWYYCWPNGKMACNTNIGQYYLNFNGEWIENSQFNSKTIANNTKSNISNNDINLNNKIKDKQDDEYNTYIDDDNYVPKKSTSKKSKSDYYDYSNKSSSEVYVHGYYRKGKYIKPHYRTKKDHTTKNNYSHKGNRNPHNGKRGYKK